MLTLLACAPQAPWRVELPLSLNASAPASNVETIVTPWIGVRLGQLAPWPGPGLVDGNPMLWGADVAIALGHVSDGTPQVSTARTSAFIEGRGLVAPGRFASTFSAFVPYGFLGVSAGGGVLEVKAFDDARLRPLFTWGARVGAGAELQVHALTTRLELGAGLRDLRFELTSALAIGVAF